MTGPKQVFDSSFLCHFPCPWYSLSIIDDHDFPNLENIRLYNVRVGDRGANEKAHVEQCIQYTPYTILYHLGTLYE